MTTVAALLDSAGATAVMRRAIPRGYAMVRGCRTASALERLMATSLVDVAVIGLKAAQLVDLAVIRRAYPVVPIVVFGPIKPDHGEVIRGLHERGIAAVTIEGVDDPVVGDLVMENGYLSRRRRELRDLPRLLRLTEPLQRATLEQLLKHVGLPKNTGSLAREIGVSREHLSRQFAAGGAPNLKRVISLLQVLAARDLITSPGYSLKTVVSLLGFAGPSHLRSVVRRVTRLSLRDFRRATVADLTRRFAGQGSRSRG